MTKSFRVLGNIGIIAGQIILLFGSREVGLVLLIVSSFLGLPYFLQHRYYDIVSLILVGVAINTAGLFWGHFR